MSLLLAIPPGYATPFFPSAGLALAALLIFGSSSFYGVWLGSFALNLSISILSPNTISLPLITLVCACIGFGASVQAFAGVKMVRGVIRYPNVLVSWEEVWKFIAYGLLSCLVNSIFGVTALSFAGVISSSNYVFNFWTWWVGDGLGVVILTPLLLILFEKTESLTNSRRRAVSIPSFISLVLIIAFNVVAQETNAVGGWQAWLLMTGSLVCWAVLEAFLLVVTGRRLMVQRAVEEKTKELTEANLKLEKIISDLRKSEERFRLLVFAVQDYAIFMVNREGIVSSWNKGAERIYGYSESEILGKPLTTFFAPVDIDDKKPEKELALALYKGSHTEECLRVRKNGQVFWANVLITAVNDKDGNLVGFAKVTRDLTEWKVKEEELRKTNERLDLIVQERTKELRESNELLVASNSELERFAYLASHDLQEPLRVITLYLQLLESKAITKLNEEDKKYIDVAVKSAQRMQFLIKDLLTVARISKSDENLKEVNFNDVLTEAKNNLEKSIQENNAQIISEHLPTFKADPTQMIRLFQNLISNALKYRGKETPLITISVREERDRTIFRVKDNGIGIKPEFLEKIFVIFQRLHSDREKYPGTGIGLAISKKIVERHGGRIWAESTPGVGSSFCFSLPHNLETAKTSSSLLRIAGKESSGMAVH